MKRDEVEIKANKFVDEIIEIEKKYHMTISHEDTHGAFLITPYNTNDVKWIKNAHLYYTNIEHY